MTAVQIKKLMTFNVKYTHIYGRIIHYHWHLIFLPGSYNLLSISSTFSYMSCEKFLRDHNELSPLIFELAMTISTHLWCKALIPVCVFKTFKFPCVAELVDEKLHLHSLEKEGGKKHNNKMLGGSEIVKWEEHNKE